MNFNQDTKKNPSLDPKCTEIEKNKTLNVKSPESGENKNARLRDTEKKAEVKSAVPTSEKKESMDIKPGLTVCAKAEGQGNHHCGEEVAKVDHLDGHGFIKLNKNDSPDGKHHWIPTGWVEKVDQKSIHLNKTKEEFRSKRLNELPISNLEKRAS